MANMLLTLDHKQLNSLVNDKKKYVFRRFSLKKDINKVLLYEKYPSNKVVGEAKVIDIIRNTPSNVWKMTNNLSTITKDAFDSYYNGSTNAIAYELSNIKLYKTPKPIEKVEYEMIN